MALWRKVKNLPSDSLRQLQAVYGEHFPLEVRAALAHWLEGKPWNELDPENPQHDEYAFQLVTSLIEEIERKAVSTDENFLMKLKLTEASGSFRLSYTHNPQQLIRVVKHCLQSEMRAVQLVENQYLGVTDPSDRIPEQRQMIILQLDKLKRTTQETQEELGRMQQEQESFVIQYQESFKCQACIQQLGSKPQGPENVGLLAKLQREKQILDQSLRQRIAALSQMRVNQLEKYDDTCTRLDELQKCVLENELIRWKSGQQLLGNGVPYENNLDQIQEWCEALAEIIWQNRQQIQRIEMLFTQLPLNVPSAEILQSLTLRFLRLLSSLVISTFVIEKQPPQVLKKNTRFSATVRLLVGGKLNIHMTPPQVKVTIISEARANSLLKSDKEINGIASSGEILNNSGTMEYHQATRQLTVSFRNMQLRDIKRAAEKKVTESVMEEKCSLLFQSEFKVGNSETKYQVSTLSLPVVVIVHGNQETNAWATVTWNNAFAEPIGIKLGRVSFHTPDKVKWSDFGMVLSSKFKSVTGRGLTEDNLQYLASKAFRSVNDIQHEDYTNMILSWSQIGKEHLPHRSFTFWEWFYAIMKVTKEHLKDLWVDDLIMGFVGKRQAEDLLRTCCQGTFILRFSDSELGGITIAWIEVKEDQQESGKFCMVAPFTSKDLSIRGLADQLNDLKSFTYLYPERPKDKFFAKYYTSVSDEQPQPSNGYVKRFLVTHIPGLSGPVISDSCPGTPQPLMAPQSPDGYYNDSQTNCSPVNLPVTEMDELDWELIASELNFSNVNDCAMEK